MDLINNQIQYMLIRIYFHNQITTFADFEGEEVMLSSSRSLRAFTSYINIYVFSILYIIYLIQTKPNFPRDKYIYYSDLMP